MSNISNSGNQPVSVVFANDVKNDDPSSFRKVQVLLLLTTNVNPDVARRTAVISPNKPKVPSKIKKIVEKKVFKCSQCTRVYTNENKLSVHIKRCHADESKSSEGDSASVEEEKKWQCHYCICKYKRKTKLNQHIRTCHSDKVKIRKGKQICPVCDENFIKVADIHSHIKYSHKDIPLCFEKKFFTSKEQFEEWKEKVEIETTALFVSCRRQTLPKGRKFRYLCCHRSGTATVGLRIKGAERVRQLKQGGSVKMGKTCPALMKVYEKVTPVGTTFEVEFQSVHVGHEMDPEKIPIPKNIKKEIAEQLSQGVDRLEIISGIQKKYQLKKKINLKSLNNIAKNFNIDKALLFKDDAIDAKVQKLLKEKGNPVIIYKPVGEELPDYPSLGKDEFLLGIMNDRQKDLLQLYGNDVILIDSAYGANPFTFQLTILLVNDGSQEGLPIAFMYSYRPTEETFIVFFVEILRRLSINLKPHVLMTDGNASFYNAWKCVFGSVPRQLISHSYLWHTWVSNVNFRVKDPPVRKHIKNELKRIINECDEDNFKKFSKECVTEWLNSESTLNFARYFDSTFMNCTDQWASCYRLGLNTNIKLEYWHRELKYEEMDRKVIKSVNKSLDILFYAVSKKLISKIKSLDRKNLPEFIIETRQRHLESKKIQSNSVLEVQSKKQWRVSESSEASDLSLDTFNVYFESSCRCNVKCNDCNVCIHQFTCNCYDYCVKFQICKHIHFISQNYAKSLSDIHSIEEEEEDSSSNAADVIIDTIEYDENCVFVDNFSGYSSISDLETEKAVLFTKIHNMQDLIVQSRSIEQLRKLREGLENTEREWLDITGKVLVSPSVSLSLS